METVFSSEKSDGIRIYSRISTGSIELYAGFTRLRRSGRKFPDLKLYSTQRSLELGNIGVCDAGRISILSFNNFE
jgi:hypothetical protein